MNGCVHVCQEKKCKSKTEGGERTKWTQAVRTGKGRTKAELPKGTRCPTRCPAPSLGPHGSSWKHHLQQGSPRELLSTLSLGSLPSPCEAGSGMSSTRAKGTDSCPRPPLPGVCSGGTALHPRRPPFPKLQGQEGQGVACGTEGRGGEDPSCIPMEVGSPPAQPPPGLARPTPCPHPSPTTIICTAGRTPEATQVPTRGHAQRRAHTHRAAYGLPGGKGCGGAGHGVWHRESDLR